MPHPLHLFHYGSVVAYQVLDKRERHIDSGGNSAGGPHAPIGHKSLVSSDLDARIQLAQAVKRGVVRGRAFLGA